MKKLLIVLVVFFLLSSAGLTQEKEANSEERRNFDANYKGDRKMAKCTWSIFDNTIKIKLFN